MTQDQLFLNGFNQMKQFYLGRHHEMRFLRFWQLESDQDASIAISPDMTSKIVKKYVGANFYCVGCRHQWYSRIHSSVLFEYNPISRKIKWRLFGQQCARCQQDYISPVYTLEAIEETMRYLIEMLGQKLHHVDLRPRNPDRPTIIYNGARHREDDLACLCEACTVRRRYCEN